MTSPEGQREAPESAEAIEYTDGLVGRGIRKMCEKGRISLPENGITWNGKKIPPKFRFTPLTLHEGQVIFLVPSSIIKPHLRGSPRGTTRHSNITADRSHRIGLNKALAKVIGEPGHKKFTGKGPYCVLCPENIDDETIAELTDDQLRQILRPEITKIIFEEPDDTNTVSQILTVVRSELSKVGERSILNVNVQIGGMRVRGTLTFERPKKLRKKT